MDALFARFLEEKRYLANVSPSTVIFYQNSYRALKKILGEQLLSTPEAPVPLTKQLLKSFVIGLQESGVAVSSINCWSRGINSFLSWLYENEHLTEKLRIKLLPEEKKRKPTYTEAELKALLSWKPSTWTEWRLYALIHFLIDTGARINEALTLTRAKIDFDNLLLTIKGKGNKERVIPMSPELRKVLYSWLKKHSFDLVFPNRDRAKLRPSNIRRDLKALYKKLGISTTGSFHKFRHTFGYNFARTVATVTGDAHNGIFHLQQQLGHTTLQTTKIYVDIQPEDLALMHKKTSILSRLK